MSLGKTVKCPICGKEIALGDREKLPPSFPFCSRRCKLIDLGKWLDEEYGIGGPHPDGNASIDDES